MSVFLIDYENLHTSAFSGLEDLTEEDRVFIFYTNNSDNLTFSLMERLVKAKAKIEYQKVNSGGKNSLDFQLCSYLGYLIGTNRDTRFCIVSRDKGYLTMLSFWGEKTENGNTVVCGATIRNSLNRLPADAERDEIIPEAQETLEPVFVQESEPERPQPEQSQPEQSRTEEPQPEEPQPEQPEEQPVEKPKRKYNRRAPYKRKTKTPAEQSA